MNPLVTIGHTFEEHRLTLISSPNNSISWADYPVTLTQSQHASIKNLPAVIAFLEGFAKPPSEVANIKTQICCGVIHFIDKEYRAANRKYKNDLALAEGDDLKIITKLSKQYHIRSYTGFFGLWYAVREYFGVAYKSKIELDKEGSTHRLAFMQQVSMLETMRLDSIKEKISNCITPLLKDLKRRQVEDISLLKELDQITAIYNALFPHEQDDEVDEAMNILAKISRESRALLTM
jgi:hypothetical protein